MRWSTESRTRQVATPLPRLNHRTPAAEFLATGRPLHVLINNAGLGNTKGLVTDDTIEMVFAVNHLAYYLLNHAPARPAQRERAGSNRQRRLGGASVWTINFDDLGRARRYSTFGAYGQSKLANIIFSYELARRLARTGVTVNCLHPGGIASGLWTNNGPLAQFVMWAGKLFLKTPEQGARTTIYLASSPEVEGVTGKYYANCREKNSNRESYDLSVARRLWDISEQMTGLTSSES